MSHSWIICAVEHRSCRAKEQRYKYILYIHMFIRTHSYIYYDLYLNGAAWAWKSTRMSMYRAKKERGREAECTEVSILCLSEPLYIGLTGSVWCRSEEDPSLTVSPVLMWEQQSGDCGFDGLSAECSAARLWDVARPVTLHCARAESVGSPPRELSGLV